VQPGNNLRKSTTEFVGWLFDLRSRIYTRYSDESQDRKDIRMEEELFQKLVDAVNVAILTSPEFDDALSALESLGLELESLSITATLAPTTIATRESDCKFLRKLRIVPDF
jgi:hypothetical protein